LVAATADEQKATCLLDAFANHRDCLVTKYATFLSELLTTPAFYDSDTVQLPYTLT
jgi:hypothetical protein